ncbi:MAG: NAD kinase [Bacteroidia bacterium]|nr:NAD kinase [Bacteroidia bacterium]MDW8159747.1 NAD kinase [Bacteroidia bacterium]
MKIVLYGRLTKNTCFSALASFFRFLDLEKIEYTVYHLYAEELLNSEVLKDYKLPTFRSYQEIQGFDFLYSIGGDGTILQSVPFAIEANLAILGVNVGRLGFLAGVSQYDLITATQDLQRGAWREESRSLVEVETNAPIFGMHNYGLNEVTIHKSNTNEMITVHTFVNGEFMNSYWADGLIIATPTGSTAYSLACGGPIIFPISDVFVLTPIAPHSLTVRPVILPDRVVISFEIESRSGQALIAIDNRTILVNNSIEIAIKKSSFKVRLVKLKEQSYFMTLRKRLNWGVDTRN